MSDSNITFLNVRVEINFHNLSTETSYSPNLPHRIFHTKFMLFVYVVLLQGIAYRLLIADKNNCQAATVSRDFAALFSAWALAASRTQAPSPHAFWRASSLCLLQGPLPLTTFQNSSQLIFPKS